MFDKIKFAQIIKKISDTYESQREFSKKSKINRTYLSQYMNMKLDEPPKPKILNKLSNASNGVTTYEELMNICGYININEDYGTIPVYAQSNKFNKKINFLLDLTNSDDMSSRENEAFNEIAYILIDHVKKNQDFDLDDLLFDTKLLYSNLSYKEQSTVKQYLQTLVTSKNFVQSEALNFRSMQIPVFAFIRAGVDYFSNENIIGHVYLDFTPLDHENYYAIQVTGDSMEPLFSNGDIAIVHKQDTFEDGNTCIVLINGYDATVNKVIKTSDGIELIAMNPYYPVRHFNKKEIDEMPIKIIGKVIEARKRKIFE